MIKTFLYPTQKTSPSNRKVVVTLTYMQVRDANQIRGTMRTAATSFELPFNFFCNLMPETIKDNDNAKVILQVDRPVPSLLRCFKDLIEPSGFSEMLTDKRKLSFQLHNGQPVSLLVAKDDLKIRV